MTEHLGAPQSITHDLITGELVLTWWRVGDPKAGEPRVVEIFKTAIPSTELVSFVTDVTREALFVIRDEATALAYGDCGLCGNRRLVEVVQAHGGTTTLNCPVCRKDGGREAFSNVPRYRRGSWDPTTSYEDYQKMMG